MFRNVFEPEKLHEIARAVVGYEGRELIDRTTQLLADAYPGEIWEREPQWLMSNAAGSMYSICVLHATLHEYILIYGTPIGTHGHTGRHRFNTFYDFVLDGELLYFDEDRPFDLLVFRPGDRFDLPPGQAQGFVVPDRTWVLEYGRGFIPAALPFGLADSVLSTLDFKTIRDTMSVYGQFMLPYFFGKLFGRAPARTSGRRTAPDVTTVPMSRAA